MAKTKTPAAPKLNVVLTTVTTVQMTEKTAKNLAAEVMEYLYDDDLEIGRKVDLSRPGDAWVYIRAIENWCKRLPIDACLEILRVLCPQNVTWQEDKGFLQHTALTVITENDDLYACMEDFGADDLERLGGIIKKQILPVFAVEVKAAHLKALEDARKAETEEQERLIARARSDEDRALDLLKRLGYTVTPPVKVEKPKATAKKKAQASTAELNSAKAVRK